MLSSLITDTSIVLSYRSPHKPACSASIVKVLQQMRQPGGSRHWREMFKATQAETQIEASGSKRDSLSMSEVWGMWTTHCIFMVILGYIPRDQWKNDSFVTDNKYYPVPHISGVQAKPPLLNYSAHSSMYSGDPFLPEPSSQLSKSQ